MGGWWAECVVCRSGECVVWFKECVCVCVFVFVHACVCGVSAKVTVC